MKKKVRKVIQREIIEEVEEEVTIPDHWGMFTSKGNKRITTLATRLYNAIDNPDLSIGKKVDALHKFHADWEKMSQYESYGEASDTAVRECVGAFHDEMADQIGIDGDDLWDNFWRIKNGETVIIDLPVS